MPLVVDENLPTNNLEYRFFEHVEKTDDCWYWTGRRAPQGYGNFRVDGKSIGAHRLSYEMFVGPIRENRVIDHVCHNNTDCRGEWECMHRRCVNPDHLEAVTQAENLRRSHITDSGKTHCVNGHEFNDTNTKFNGEAGVARRCKVCRRATQKRSYYRKRMEQINALNS